MAIVRMAIGWEAISWGGIRRSRYRLKPCGGFGPRVLSILGLDGVAYMPQSGSMSSGCMPLRLAS